MLIRLSDVSEPPAPPELLRHARMRVASALQHFASARSAEVTLESVAGISLCRVHVRLSGGPPIVVTHRDADMRKAIDAAADAASNLADARSRIATNGLRARQ